VFDELLLEELLDVTGFFTCSVWRPSASNVNCTTRPAGSVVDA